MIGVLEKLDERTAVGVLARAALSLEDEGNPDAKAILEGEGAIRSTVLREARQHLGIEQDDYRPETIEKLSDFLDQESDRLVGVPDTDSALKRLAERGDLPSDLYKIDIVEGLANFHGANFDLEKQLIEATIRSPSQEQHFGPESDLSQPALISLFARQFETPFPYKDFTMLVAAERNGLILNVHQAWRLYPSLLNIRNVENLVDLLRRFADAYGFDVEIDGKRGHFFLLLDQLVAPHINVKMPRGQDKAMTISHFVQANKRTGRKFSALVVAIDLQRYQATLDRMKLKPSDIFNGVAL